MKIKHTESVSKILTDLCLTRQNIKLKNIFADTVSNILVVTGF